MATVFKRTRTKNIPKDAEIVTQRGKRLAVWTDRKTGRKRKAPLNEAGDKIVVQSEHYLIQYYDETGERREVNSRTPDRDAAEQLASRLETEAMLRQRGIVDATQERFAAQGKRPLAEHLDEFKQHLAAKGRTANHVESTGRHVKAICADSGAEQIGDLTGTAVQRAIGNLRDAGKSLRTCNAHLRSIKSFTRWLWREKRTPDDALAGLSAFNETTDRRHIRRELTPDEIQWLLTTVEKQDLPNFKLDGMTRAMAYRVALGTGFRVKELRTMTPTSFDPTTDPPTATVEAGYSKRGRRDEQPIRSDLAQILADWLAGRPRDEQLFPLPHNTSKMLQRDLKAARTAWIEAAETDKEKAQRAESDFLRYEDADGRVTDFHALRHSYISGIVASGASVKTAQELARHSTPMLTIGRYSHTRLHDLRGAIEALPTTKTDEPQMEVQLATGTDDIVPANRQQLSGESVRMMASDGK